MAHIENPLNIFRTMSTPKRKERIVCYLPADVLFTENSKKKPLFRCIYLNHEVNLIRLHDCPTFQQISD